MSIVNRESIHARLALAISGIEKRLPSLPSVALLGVTYTRPQAIALFQKAIDTSAEVALARAKWLEAVKADRAATRTALLALFDLRSLARCLFGSAAEPLADFGFTPRKVENKRSGDAIQKAAERARATRKARRTMGKNQKKDVRGSLEVPRAALP